MKLGRRNGPRLGRGGQHMFEYALLIGMVTIVALVMQLLGRQSMQAGLRGVSDFVLGPPPAPKAPDPDATPLTVNVNDCAGNTLSATGTDLVVSVGCSDVQETGDASFRRLTQTQETSRGASVNEDTRMQFLKDID